VLALGVVLWLALGLRLWFGLGFRYTLYVYYVSTKPNCTLLVRYCHVAGRVGYY